ncbi:MAG: hypothetical protein RL065_805, partial [Bacteroidota bacterium]
QTINSYVSGTNISINPSSTTNYSLVSVMDNVYYFLTTSGAATVTVSPNVTWYLDADNDGYYVNTQSNCVSPGIGWNTTGGTNGDCNDNDNTKHSSFGFYVDADNDGFGTGSLQQICAVNASTPPSGYSLSNIDCNDNNASIHSPIQYFLDVDGDGFGSTSSNFLCSTTTPVGYSTNSTDCDDNNINIHQQFQFYVDNDNDGFGSTTTAMVCAANSTSAPVGYSTNALDCNDNNSALTTGNTFYVDADNDGYGSTSTAILCSSVATTGYSSNNTDCDDNNASIHIGNTFYIDADGDGYGSTTSVILCNTSAPIGYSVNNTDCNDNNSAIHSATLIPTVSVAVSPSAIVTQGTSVTFTASITNGGTSPVYQWQKNNNLVGSNQNTYSTTPNNSDSIWCLINSNAQCVSTPNAFSNKIKMTVTPVSTGGGSNDFPCGSLSASSNIGSIAGYSTVFSAYDNGSGVYSGLDNSLVNNAPPSGPSLVYFSGNNTNASFVGEPVSSCAPTSVGYSPKTVWYKFRVPTFSAGVSIRSVTSYGQLYNANLAVYSLTSGLICSNPIFNEVKCSSSGVLVLNSTELSSYQGQYLYVQLQGTVANPSGQFTVSIQGIISSITLTNPTSSSIQVNFPTVSTPNLTTYLYWQRVGTQGISYVVLSPRANYVINGLLSGYNYKVWIKLADRNSVNGSQIYCSSVTLSTLTGCSGVLPAPNINGISGHCSQAMFTVINPLNSIPLPLQTSPSLYPYRLIYYLPNTNRGWIYTLQSIPITGFFVNSLILNKTYGFYYTYKCVGGALVSSMITNYSTCNTAPRLNTEHHEYLINGVHYIDCDMEDLMAAAAPENLKADEWNEIVFEEIKSENDYSTPFNQNTKFALVPNPADNSVSIEITDITNETTISMYDVAGKIVFEKIIDAQNESSTIIVNTNNYANGTYIVNVKSATQNSSQKLMVAH